MTTDPFEELMNKLGVILDIPLHPDKNRACAIQTHEKLIVQLQLDTAQENLLLASFLCELPPGKFRENVLCEALKANNLPDPRAGILGYLSSTNRLTMHQCYPLAKISAEQLAMIVAGFIDYAELWRAAIEKGEVSPAPIRGKTEAAPPPFGLKR